MSQPSSLNRISRRELNLAAATTLAGLATSAHAGENAQYQLKYSLASCMYGYEALSRVLPEVAKTGAKSIDIWPKVHGNQREQIDEMGEDTFAELLRKHDVSLGCLTHYVIGPFGLAAEFQFAKRLGCPLIVTGAKGPKDLQGDDLKAAVASFVEKMKPHLEKAAECHVTIAIENHGNNLIDSPDSIKWLVELSGDTNLGVAIAPYHLPQDADAIAQLIRDIGPKLSVFYAWQHGMGCMKKLPKEQELLQMPGRGKLDFKPLVRALRDINFAGPTEVFMHPVPRGVPILDQPSAVTDEINRSRRYLDDCLGA
ncbi:MAG: hypothetical protein Aurels2KO_29260 [Aureliella sp.]